MAQLTKTVAEVNTLLDQLTELLKSGTEIPKLATSLRGLSVAGRATESKVSGEILSAACAMGIGVCSYDSITLDAETGTAQSIDEIVYLSSVNRICAMSSDDGMLYKDWVDAASPYAAWRNREYMCNADNTPISGKLYLINKDGDYVLYFYDGRMIELVNFDGLKATVTNIPKVKIFGDLYVVEPQSDVTDIIGSATEDWWNNYHEYVFFANCDIGQVPVGVYVEGDTLTLTFIDHFGDFTMIEVVGRLLPNGSTIYTAVSVKQNNLLA